jgi:hypothetical protein
MSTADVNGIELYHEPAASATPCMETSTPLGRDLDLRNQAESRGGSACGSSSATLGFVESERGMEVCGGGRYEPSRGGSGTSGHGRRTGR